jgi:hypothetical protein
MATTDLHLSWPYSQFCPQVWSPNIEKSTINSKSPQTISTNQHYINLWNTCCLEINSSIYRLRTVYILLKKRHQEVVSVTYGISNAQHPLYSHRWDFWPVRNYCHIWHQIIGTNIRYFCYVYYTSLIFLFSIW